MPRGSCVRIRLQRFGRPFRPFYRIVACKRDAPRDGKVRAPGGTHPPRGNAHLEWEIPPQWTHTLVRECSERGGGCAPRLQFLEILGTYDPLPDINGNKQVTLKADAVKRWMMHGAEPSERVSKLLGIGEMLPPFPRRGLLRDDALLADPTVSEAEGDDELAEDGETSAAEAAEGGESAGGPASEEAGAGAAPEGAASGDAGPRTS
jgi:ribosomal protein S16